MRGRALPAVALALVLALAAYLRLSGLGRYELWSDELYTYFAAQSLARDAGPLLPSGEAYRRGMDLTRLVALANAHVAPRELATRLPSALFGILNVALFAFVAWRMAGAWAAVAAALMLAVYPEAVFQSRYTRFYTYQLNFGLVALLAGWQIVRHAGDPRPPTRERVLATWLAAAIAGLALLLAARVQVTTLSAVSGFALALALAAVADLRARGRAAWRESVPLALTAAGVTGAVLVAAAAPRLVRELAELSQFTPLWYDRAADGEFSVRAYYWSLSEAFPLLVSLAPLVFLYVAVRDWRLGTYLFVWFAVPFLLHSFLFPWKQPRFILLAVPALLLAGAIAFVALLRAAYDLLVGALAARDVGGTRRHLAAGAAIAVVALVALVTTPAFNRARKLATSPMTPVMDHDYRKIGELIRAVPGSDSIPVGSVSPLRSLLYWGRVDFVVNTNFLERLVVDSTGSRSMRMNPEGVPDFYSGAPVLASPEAIRARFAGRGRVLIVPEQRRTPDTAPLRATLEAQAQELCAGRCGGLRLYLWHLRAPAAAGDGASPRPERPAPGAANAGSAATAGGRRS
jgi:hypothetical protein